MALRHPLLFYSPVTSTFEDVLSVCCFQFLAPILSSVYSKAPILASALVGPLVLSPTAQHTCSIAALTAGLTLSESQGLLPPSLAASFPLCLAVPEPLSS